MTNDIAIAVRRQVPSVPKAIAMLVAMEAELSSASTYEQIRRVIKEASALKVLLGEVDAVRVKAEDTILLANRRIGEELATVSKATGKKIAPGQNSKAATGIEPTARHRYGKLASASVEMVKQTAAKLRASGKDATLKAVVAEITHGDKKQRRATKMQALAGKALAMPDKPFVVAVMDPPWRQEPWSRETGLNKAPDNHYPTLTPKEIAALKPPLTEDAVVYMWTTTSMMRVAQTILEDWGLEYRSHMIWVKERPGKQTGTGHWSRVDHEIVLIYVQGKPPAPAESDRISSVLYSPVGKHSEKPDSFFAMLERTYPEVPKLEMYGRKLRPGWVVWGNEVEA